MYGDTPYGRVTVERDIAEISRDLLVSLHRDFVKPDGAIMVITGRINRQDAQRLVEKHFGGWQARGSALPAPPPVPTEPTPGIYFITLPFSQASVQMGQLGVPRLTPDYPAIDMFNEIFGTSGFGSRLMQKVRTELGLTYGVYGGISPGVVRGTNSIFLQTKAESVAPAIKESLAVLTGLQERPPLTGEMEEKKNALRNSYVLNFDSLDEIAIRRARLKLLEYPADYDKTYLPKIGVVTPEDVQQVAQSRWQEKSFVVVVVGNEAAYRALESSLRSGEGWKKPFELKRLRFESAIVIQ
jgi:zinc protease